MWSKRLVLQPLEFAILDSWTVKTRNWPFAVDVRDRCFPLWLAAYLHNQCASSQCADVNEWPMMVCALPLVNWVLSVWGFGIVAFELIAWLVHMWLERICAYRALRVKKKTFIGGLISQSECCGHLVVLFRVDYWFAPLGTRKKITVVLRHVHVTTRCKLFVARSWILLEGTNLISFGRPQTQDTEDIERTDGMGDTPIQDTKERRRMETEVSWREKYPPKNQERIIVKTLLVTKTCVKSKNPSAYLHIFSLDYMPFSLVHSLKRRRVVMMNGWWLICLRAATPFFCPLQLGTKKIWRAAWFKPCLFIVYYFLFLAAVQHDFCTTELQTPCFSAEHKHFQFSLTQNLHMEKFTGTNSQNRNSRMCCFLFVMVSSCLRCCSFFTRVEIRLVFMPPVFWFFHSFCIEFRNILDIFFTSPWQCCMLLHQVANLASCSASYWTTSDPLKQTLQGWARH